MKNLIILIVLVSFILLAFHLQENANSKENNGLILSKETGSEILQSDSNSMIFELIPENRFYLLNNGKSELYVMAKVVGADDLEQKKRTPLNISLVMDRSGSMASENKLENVKKACNLVIDNLTSEDKLSIIAYDHNVNIVQGSGFVKNKSVLQQKINEIQTSGSTNLSGGMLEGFAQVTNTYEKKSVNRVLLLSDGLANQGITSTAKLQDIVQKKYSQDNIAISTFGVGADFNEDLMTNLAEYGRGNYYFISSPDTIPEIFKNELDGLLSVVAQNTVLELNFPKEFLEIEKVFGYKYKIDGNKLTIDYNDVFAKEEKIVLIKFKVKELPPSNLSFSASLNYDDVLHDYKRVTKNANLKIVPTDDTEKFNKSVNKEVQRNIIMFTAIDNFELAAKKVDERKYKEAKNIMKFNIEYMKNNKMLDVESDTMLLEQFNNYKDYSKKIENVEKMRESEKKMLQKSNKNINYKLKKKKKK